MSFTVDGPLNAFNMQQQLQLQLQQCRKDLEFSVDEAKASIHSTFSRLLELVRSREVFLVNQLDVIRRLHDDVIRTQEMSTSCHTSKSAASSRRTSSASAAEPEVVESLVLPPPGGVRFEADLSAVRQAVCQFGKLVTCSKQTPSIGQFPDENSASFVFNSFQHVLDLTRLTQSDVQVKGQLDEETDPDPDDFVVIAEDDNVSIDVERIDDNESTTDVDSTFDRTTTRQLVDDQSATEHATDDTTWLLREDFSVNPQPAEVGRSNEDHTCRSTSDQAVPAFTCFKDEVPEMNWNHWSKSEQHQTSEFEPIHSTYLARLSALPMEHWLAR